jgi:hypothetical protein
MMPARIPQRKMMGRVRITLEAMRDYYPWRKHPIERLKLEWWVWRHR